MSGHTISRGSWLSVFRSLWWRGGSSAASPRGRASSGGVRGGGRLMTDRGPPRAPCLGFRTFRHAIIIAPIIWTAHTPRLTEKQHARYNRWQPLARAGRAEERGIWRLEAAQHAV